MPPVIAAAAATAFTVGGVAVTYGAIFQASAIAIGIARGYREQRKLQRQQQASLQDRTTPVRQSDAARTIVYGRTRVSGPIVYHKTHGTRNESVSHVIPIAGHEITAVDDVWFNDKSIAPWSGGPVSPGSPYFVSRATAYAHRFTGTGTTQSLPAYGGSLVAVDTVSYTNTTTIESGTGDAYTIVTSSEEVQLAPGAGGYTVGGTGTAPTITLNAAAANGKSVTVTYRIDRGDAYASVWVFLGTAAGERDLNLETWSGGEWTSAAVGRNVARLHVMTVWQETLYATGFPGVSAIVRGKRVYDPRLDSTNGGSGTHRADTASTWAYSDNPALCAVDYLRDALGFGCASTEIDWPSVIAAANICDELVPIDAGIGTQKRYTVAGVLSTETDRKTNLEAILDSMVGIAVYSGGKWTIRAGAYVTPTLDLDEGDLAGGDVTIQARANRRDLFNSVRGRYREPNQLYQVTDFPPYVSTTYQAEDAGEVIYREIDLPMVDDARRAQRIAKLILFRARQALTIQATFKLSAYALQPGDTCRLTIGRYGWVNKVFRVLRREFGSLSTVRLTMQEDASAIYSWSFNEATNPDPAPNTSLPDPRFVALPGAITFASNEDTFYVRPDGTIVPYVAISWAVPAADDVRIEVFWKRSSELEYRRIVAPIGASYVWLEGVSAGEVLNVYLEAVNGIGARSARFWRPSYRVGDVQSGIAPLSANLLRNATFEFPFAPLPAEVINLNAGDFADFRKHPSSDYFVPGSPSSAYLRVLSALTGNGRSGFYRWPSISASAGEWYAGYASLVGWATDARVALQFFDATGAQIGATEFGNVVPGNPWESVRWNVPGNYAVSAVITQAPAGTRTARLCVFATGNWTVSTINEHDVSVHRPFFGRVAANTTQLPPWDPGGANVSGTAGISPGAVTAVVESPIRSSGEVPLPLPSERYSTALPFISLTGAEDFEEGATLRVHVCVLMALTGRTTAPSLLDLAVVIGLVDVYYNAAGQITGEGGTSFAGFLFDQHFSAARSLAGVTFSGSVTYQMTTTYTKGRRRDFGLLWQFYPSVVDNSNFTMSIVGPSHITIEVLKR